MSTELLGTLGARRSAVEAHGETWESKPLDSIADRKHSEKNAFGKAPSSAEWMKQRVVDMPEEDLRIDSLDEVLRARGCRPSHAPAPEIEASIGRIDQASDALIVLQRRRLEEKGALAADREQVAKLEAEVAALQVEIRQEKERAEREEEEQKNYPHPVWLEKYEGTINVAITGNSGAGKSLLINRIRRVRPGSYLWAPVGVTETTMAPTMYIFPGRDKLRLWDLPGADTQNFPRDTYIRNMGLRYFDSVLIVSAGRFTETELELRKELEQHQVPFLMVRTKVDIDVMNNMTDNDVGEEDTLNTIRDEFFKQHGNHRSYLVSSRDPEKYDMPVLLRDAFPGLKHVLDANATVFQPGEGGVWGDAWSLPVNSSPLLSALQGQWRDMVDNSMYIVDGSEVHVTLNDGMAGVVTLIENGAGIWWNNRWFIEMSSVQKARENGELRWTPADLQAGMKPLVWRWLG